MPLPKPKNRTRWSAIVQDWQFVEGYSDRLFRCYRLSERAAVSLLGICEYLAWDNRWTNVTAVNALRELTAAAERGLSEPLSCETDNCTFYDCLWPIFEYQYHWPLDNTYIPQSWSYDADHATVFALSNVGAAAPEIYFTLPHGSSCTIHLQTVLLGGKVQVFDGGFTPIATVDTYADVTSIPPETTTEIQIPVAAYAEDTLITIRFTASFDLEEIPLTFGGGFLGVTFCGDISIMPFELRQNESNPCLLEQTLNSGQSWLTAFDFSLCSSATSQTVIRFNTELNIYQISYDGGTTWNDGTNTVPQTTTPLFPLPELAVGQEAKCKAVNNVIAELKSNVAENTAILTNGGTIGALSAPFAALLAWAIIGTAGLVGIIAAAAAAILTVSAAVFAAAFTDEDVWQPLTELLYCNVGDDMSFTQEQWFAVWSGIDGIFSGVANKHISNVLVLLGANGLTNVARTDHGVYDDTFCNCNTWCYTFDFTATDGGFSLTTGYSYGSWSSGIGWVGTTAGTGYSAMITRMFNTTTLTSAMATLAYTPNGSLSITEDELGATLYNHDITSGIYGVSDVAVSVSGITLNPSAGAAQGGNFALTALTLTGIGANPFGEGNC